MPRGINIANAPVSYGAFELTVGHDDVEAPWEIGRVLEVSDIGLCLDTGLAGLGL
jgi:hypothetical protein